VKNLPKFSQNMHNANAPRHN